MDADNQQERLDASWIVGFTDGEGCFHISINKIPEMSLGWQVLPEFRIVQHEKDEELLQKIRDYFGFGSVTINRTDNHGTRKEFRVRGMENLNQIIKFFRENSLKTSKRKDFEIFSEVIDLMDKKVHLTKEGLDKIAKLVSEMNRKPPLNQSKHFKIETRFYVNQLNNDKISEIAYYFAEKISNAFGLMKVNYYLKGLEK